MAYILNNHSIISECSCVGKYYLWNLVIHGVGVMWRHIVRKQAHLKKFDTKGPENLNENFNHHYYFLGNIMEQSFGMPKNKWQIL